MLMVSRSRSSLLSVEAVSFGKMATMVSLLGQTIEKVVGVGAARLLGSEATAPWFEPHTTGAATMGETSMRVPAGASCSSPDSSVVVSHEGVVLLDTSLIITDNFCSWSRI
jgi:hypothetical protein